MKKDIQALVGERTVLEREFEELCVLADNSIITIRENLNPFNIERNFTDLKIRSAMIEMRQLYENYKKAKAKLEKIKKIKTTLEEIQGAL